MTVLVFGFALVMTTVAVLWIVSLRTTLRVLREEQYWLLEDQASMRQALERFP